MKDEKSQVQENLSRFDQLDFEAFNKQDWSLLHDLHAPDVVVTFPDGRQTRGLREHDADLKAMFDWSPDMKVVRHPVGFGSGEWTAVTGVLEGTFLRPMRLPDGSTVPPTGKRYSIPMVTIARWRNRQIVEEQLFWDNLAVMMQIGPDQPQKEAA